MLEMLTLRPRELARAVATATGAHGRDGNVGVARAEGVGVRRRRHDGDVNDGVVDTNVVHKISCLNWVTDKLFFLEIVSFYFNISAFAVTLTNTNKHSNQPRKMCPCDIDAFSIDIRIDNSEYME